MSRTWRRVIILGVVIALILATGYFGMGWYVYQQWADVRGSCDKHLVNNPSQFSNVSNWPDDLDFSPYFVPEYQDVRFPSRQQEIDIAGWYLEGQADMPAVVVLDGIGGCKHAQAALLPAGMLWHNGFNVLLIDLRDTGGSGSENGYSAIGNEEYMDALGAWDWLTQEKGFSEDNVGVMGNSLGAATVLMAFLNEPSVAAIAVNSPFANLPQMIREQLGANGMPGFLAPAITTMARVVSNEDLLEYDPLDATRSAGDRPIFVVHSSDDTSVDINHSQQLEAVAKEVGADAEFWYIDGAEHVQAAGVYPDEFETRIVAFFGENLE